MVAGLGGEGESQGFMIREQVELPTFHKVAEVADGEIGS